MDPSRDLAAWTDLARRELVDLVAITSFSDQEHEAVEHLVARCAELGLPASPAAGRGLGGQPARRVERAPRTAADRARRHDPPDLGLGRHGRGPRRPGRRARGAGRQGVRRGGAARAVDGAGCRRPGRVAPRRGRPLRRRGARRQGLARDGDGVAAAVRGRSGGDRARRGARRRRVRGGVDPRQGHGRARRVAGAGRQRDREGALAGRARSRHIPARRTSIRCSAGTSRWCGRSAAASR